MTDGYLRQGARRFGIELTRLRFSLPRTRRPLDPERALARLPPKPSILFLCYGNICRSPLAERYARNNCPGDVQFDSSGFFERTGRSSPNEAVSSGFYYGVDLSKHESTRVTREAIEDSDLTLVMDVRNYRQLAREYPDCLDQTWLLKPFGPARGVEIEDPYDADRETFDRVYGEVTDAVDGLIAALDHPRGETARTDTNREPSAFSD